MPCTMPPLEHRPGIQAGRAERGWAGSGFIHLSTQTRTEISTKAHGLSPEQDGRYANRPGRLSARIY